MMKKNAPEDRDMTDYLALAEALSALIEGVPHPLSNLSNASALIWQSLDRLNWAGFYLAKDGLLVLGPFQGKPACIEIPFGRGVCGTAAAREESVLVPDVHAFPGHIACDGASASEIVVPLPKNGRVLGVLELDSPDLARFDEEDRAGLETCARIVADSLPEDFPANLL